MRLFVVLTILVLVALAAITRYVRFRRTLYVFAGGWISVSTGVLFRKETAYQLTHLASVEIKRGPIDLLTGNSKLTLDFEKHGRVTLVGLAPHRELVVLQENLLKVAKLLRSHPYTAGLNDTARI